jgi:hypothetical protein
LSAVEPDEEIVYLANLGIGKNDPESKLPDAGSGKYSAGRRPFAGAVRYF